MVSESPVLFSGEFSHTLDDKGRLMIPGAMRAAIAKSRDPENLYIGFLPGLNFLNLYTEEKYQDLAVLWNDETRYGSTKEYMENMRLFFSHIEKIAIDKAGRILVPSRFRELGGITKDVSIIGILDKMEIWDQERYKVQTEEAAKRYAEKFISDETTGIPATSRLPKC